MIKLITDFLPPVLNVIFTLLLSFYLFHTYYETKPKKVFLSCLAITAVGLWFAFVYVDLNIIRSAVILVLLFVFSCGFKMTFPKKILMSFIYLALLCVSEMIMVFLHMMFLNVDLLGTYKEPFFTLGLLINFFLLYLILFVNRRANHKFTSLYGKNLLVLLPLPIATLLVIFTEYRLADIITLNPALQLIVLVTAIVLILTNFIVFYVADNMYDKLQYESRLRAAENLINEQSKKYSAILSSSLDLRQIKHDEVNFILGALSSLNENNRDDLKKQLEARLSIAKSFNYSQPQNTFFETIADYKAGEAAARNVKLHTDFNLKNAIQYDKIDLAILLGNLIDNAIEAAEKLPDADKRIVNIFIDNCTPQLIISITNNVSAPVDTKNLSTTKRGVQNHGFGLLAVRKIVDKYSGSIFFTCKNNKFEASVILNP